MSDRLILTSASTCWATAARTAGRTRTSTVLFLQSSPESEPTLHLPTSGKSCPWERANNDEDARAPKEFGDHYLVVEYPGRL